MSKRKGTMKFFTGILLGAGIGLMFAPQEGSKTRKIVKEKINDLTSKLKEIDVKEVQEELSIRINNLKDELQNLDEERATELWEEGIKNLKKKSEELYSYAKEKGTPLLKQAAYEVNQQIYKYAKDVVKNYETKEATTQKKTANSNIVKNYETKASTTQNKTTYSKDVVKK